MAQSCVDPGAPGSKISKEYERQIEHWKVEAGGWLVQNVELNRGSTSVNEQIHQRKVQNHVQPTEVMRKSSIMEPSLIGPISVIKCPKQIHQSQHNHGLTDQAKHGKDVGKISGGRIPMVRGTEQSITIHGGNFE